MKSVLLGLSLLLASSLGSAGERALLRGHSEIRFAIKQMGVSVDGEFTRFDARVDLDPAAPERGKAELEIDIASLVTGSEEADAEAQARPWLDAAGFPKAHFASSRLRALGEDRFEARGQLTIKGRSREIVVPLRLEPQPGGGLLATGAFTLHRTDFGVGGGEWNDSDLVANEVQVRFRIALGPQR